MTDLIIEMTEAQLFALDVIAKDKQDWADNVLTNRARIAIEDLKATEAWAKSITALASAGGDVTDDEAILLKGRDEGFVKTAAELAEITEAAQEDNNPINTGIDPLTLPLTTWQVHQALIHNGVTNDPDAFIEAALSSIVDEKDRALGKSAWKNKSTHLRSAPMFNDPDLMTKAGLSKEMLDNLWLSGLTFEA